MCFLPLPEVSAVGHGGPFKRYGVRGLIFFDVIDWYPTKDFYEENEDVTNLGRNKTWT